MTAFRDAAVLVENGYAPIPIGPGTKKPPAGFTDWPQYQFDPGDAERYADHGIGLLTATTPAVDIDVNDADVVAERAEHRLGLSERVDLPDHIGAEDAHALMPLLVALGHAARHHVIGHGRDSPDLAGACHVGDALIPGA